MIVSDAVTVGLSGTPANNYVWQPDANGRLILRKGDGTPWAQFGVRSYVLAAAPSTLFSATTSNKGWPRTTVTVGGQDMTVEHADDAGVTSGTTITVVNSGYYSVSWTSLGATVSETIALALNAKTTTLAALPSANTLAAHYNTNDVHKAVAYVGYLQAGSTINFKGQAADKAGAVIGNMRMERIL